MKKVILIIVGIIVALGIIFGIHAAMKFTELPSENSSDLDLTNYVDVEWGMSKEKVIEFAKANGETIEKSESYVRTRRIMCRNQEELDFFIDYWTRNDKLENIAVYLRKTENKNADLRDVFKELWDYFEDNYNSTVYDLADSADERLTVKSEDTLITLLWKDGEEGGIMIMFSDESKF